ncbi:hypothetical protein HWV62_22297 [Athelia sp. TMB]|nr:hypothetical protein HWV62_22297 [Athelia sp. TMB]
MSFKKSKLDLLVKVRYSNPLPAPPCPPKLLQIPTNPNRYARPEFLNEIANDTSLPMIVDAECGMPLDLGRWECLWEEGGDDSDPRDRFLLEDPSSSTKAHTSGGPSTPLPQHVAWLRKTEYISRESTNKGSGQEPKYTPQVVIDVSHSAQLATIEASFAAANPRPLSSTATSVDPDKEFDLKTIRHPNKPGVTAVESYEVLPDAEIWPNAYDLFRFSERPGERNADTDDPRLDCAILRPMESDGDHFLAYYLTQTDEAALAFKASRLNPASAAGADPLAFLADDDDDEKEKEANATAFHFVRDYETVKVEQEVPNEFLLVLDDGMDESKRGKGAYYKNIERKMQLKKKRVNMGEEYLDKWQVVNLSHAAMSAEEAEEREEVRAEVSDPAFIMSGRDADADGEVEPAEAGMNMVDVVET